MASLRRVKVLLVLNLIAVAGFVLFLAKCRPITAKSGDTFHDIHPRAEVANLTAHGISSIQDAVLKRLSLLEDIVYRQLNGRNSAPALNAFWVWSRVVNRGKERVHGLLEVCLTEPRSLLCCANGVSTD